jgi:hypothetical protein
MVTTQGSALRAEPLTESQRRWLEIKKRTTKGLLLFNGERERIHQLDGPLWAVPSSEGGFWRCNLDDETCGCQDFRYACTDWETGEPFMCCKHLVAAAIKRAKDRRQRAEDRPHACIRGIVYLGIETGGVERVEGVRCRRCNR